MAGPSKRRALDEKKKTSSSGDSSTPSNEKSTTQSIPRVDGNRDPGAGTIVGRHAVDYSQPGDLKNLSEALGMAGWYTARGVSTNAILFLPSTFSSASCSQTSLNPCQSVTGGLVPSWL